MEAAEAVALELQNVQRAIQPVPLVLAHRELVPTRWLYGGGGDYFPNLSWTERPSDMARSRVPKALEDAWTVTVMAIQQAHGGRLRTGACYYLNLAGAPLVQQVLGEPVDLCAGFAAFYERRTVIRTGFRWRPAKWADWIDADAARHVEAISDVHCWLETATHLIDFDGGAGDADDVWPPIIYRPKTTLLGHPREAQDAGDVLLWRSAEARELVGAEIVPRALPIATQAVELFEIFTHGTQQERKVATAQHRAVTRLGRLLTGSAGGAARSIDMRA